MITLLTGDALDMLRTLQDCSIDAVVTDPPYGLKFMGQRWDYDVPSVDVWRECLRVLKPGGHLLAFAGTRTQHRMCVRIEDAGFEIRDMIAWVYGSGFPKSLDVSKAIDKAGGTSPREQSDMLRAKRQAAALSREQVADAVGCTPSSVRDWEEGRARATGAAIEFIVPSDEYRAKLADLLGYSADERMLIGTATDRRGDGSVYGVGHSGELRAGGKTEASRQWSGWGTALKPALEPITVARKPLAGTVAENVLQHGTGGLNIEGCRVPTNGELPNGSGNRDSYRALEGRTDLLPHHSGNQTPVAGRWPANLIHDGSSEVLAVFPASASPWIGNANTGAKGGKMFGGGGQSICDKPEYRDSGSAARFFYCAKASRFDRNEGIGGASTPAVSTDATMRECEQADWSARNGNHHPTVKPTDLMRYLCRLVTPAGGVVLDPFMGSGSTGKAAALEGFRFIGIDREPQYAEIARARIEHAQKLAADLAAVPDQLDLFTTPQAAA